MSRALAGFMAEASPAPSATDGPVSLTSGGGAFLVGGRKLHTPGQSEFERPVAPHASDKGGRASADRDV